MVLTSVPTAAILFANSASWALSGVVQVCLFLGSSPFGLHFVNCVGEVAKLDPEPTVSRTKLTGLELLSSVSYRKVSADFSMSLVRRSDKPAPQSGREVDDGGHWQSA